MAGQIVLAMVIAYLLGSIPCAYLIARLVKGVDIRKVGVSEKSGWKPRASIISISVSMRPVWLKT